VDADGEKMIAVLPVVAKLDTELMAEGLGKKRVRPIAEEQFAALFPDCELGAEPPLGRLYQLPVVVDARYAEGKTILFRAGSHEETVEMRFDEYQALERPRTLPLTRMRRLRAGQPSQIPRRQSPEEAMAEHASAPLSS
jgi:Ala-tRNA(Pro) deacylase